MSPSSAADPTALRPPSSVPAQACRCRYSRRSRHSAAVRAPCPIPNSQAFHTTSVRPCIRWRSHRRSWRQFDLPARGVSINVPDVSYANPLPDRPAAVGYHDLDRTCAELTDGDSWRRLLGPLAARDDGVIKLLLGDKRSIPPDPIAAAFVAQRMLEQGTPLWGRLAGADARALFTGVAAHAISKMPSFVTTGAGLMLATLAHTVGWPIPVGGSQAIPDALIADIRAHGGTITAGQRGHRTTKRGSTFRYRPDRAAEHLPQQGSCAVRKGIAALPIRAGCSQSGFCALRRDPMGRAAAGRGTHHPYGGHPRADGTRRA